MSLNKVAVTGLGVVTPIGNTINEFAESLFTGKSGAGPITHFDPCELPTKIAAEVKNFKTKYRDIKIDFALEAARQAVNDAFRSNEEIKTINSGLSIGLGLELFSMPDLVAFKQHGMRKTGDPMVDISFLNTPSDLCVHMIAKEYNIKAAPEVHISACAAGTDAIGSAWEAVAFGELDLVLAGGADSMINPMGVGGFGRISALTTQNESPELASKPFDKNRDGFLLGEGAGFLVLESENHAKARGAKIHGYISGYGNSLDAYSVSEPDPSVESIYRAMKGALQMAGILPGDLSGISAHGTSTPKNDPNEARAIKRLLEKNVQSTPVFATKSMIGHLISGAGSVETIATLLCMREGKIHPTINLTEPDQDCDLDHVIGESRHATLKHVLKNSFGFGGQNACIVISSALD